MHLDNVEHLNLRFWKKLYLKRSLNKRSGAFPTADEDYDRSRRREVTLVTGWMICCSCR